MGQSRRIALQQTLESATRRGVLHRLAGVAIAGVALTPFGEDSVARKRQKRKRRKKSRRNQKSTLTVRSDAFCPGPDSNGFPLHPLGVLAQSFTAGQSGSLVKAELLLGHFENITANGNLFLRLAPLVDAFPGANALATAQLAASSVPLGASRITFTFTAPASVTAGTSYALVLSRDGDGSISWLTCAGTTCEGRGYFSEDKSEPLEPRNDADFIFTTFVQS